MKNKSSHAPRGGVYLSLIGSLPSARQLRAEPDIESALKSAGSSECRMSPIYPVTPDSAPKDPLANARFVAFLCPLRPFEFIGKQPLEVQGRLWFSLGIAAVVVFAQDLAEVKVLLDQKDQFSGYEIWKYDQGKISTEEVHVRTAHFVAPLIEKPAGLSKDTLRLIEEIVINLHEAMRCAAVFVPEQVPKLTIIAKATNEIIAELKEFAIPSPQPTTTPTGSTPEETLGNHQRSNQRITQLVQLNSALAYAVSQSSHGTVPILEGPSLISNHALLGVGSAYRAISALASFVERVFEQHPIVPALAKGYGDTPGVEVFRNAARYKREVWQASGIKIDTFLPATPVVPTKPKVAYFSMRLGFAETHFSIACATQVLHAADSVRWSPMTLTHELLHSHVTGILTAIFDGASNEQDVWQKFAGFYHQFKEHSENHEAAKRPSMLESLRYMIFSYATARHAAVSNLQERDQQKDAKEDLVQLKEVLPDDLMHFGALYRGSLRLLEEVMVHTFDLFYFYSGDCDVFLALLWESWTTVPAVVGDLETYLLRSLVAIGTVENGKVQDRFNLAYNRLQKKLHELSNLDPSNIFLKKAFQHMAEAENKKRLVLLFYPCIYIADMTSMFLASKALQAKLWSDDENIEPSGEGKFLYSIETGAFTGGPIKNPIAFLADRLRKGPPGASHLDEDYRSAWLLLATASAAYAP